MRTPNLNGVLKKVVFSQNNFYIDIMQENPLIFSRWDELP